MKKYLVAIAFLIISGLLFLNSGRFQNAGTSGSARVPQPVVQPPEIQPPGVSRLAGPGQTGPPGTAVVAAEGFVRRVVAESWIDQDVAKAGRRRVRIVEADFKYPLLRLEEEVWLDPAAGPPRVVTLRTSVADHLMVGLRPDVNQNDFRRALEARGFRVRDAGSGAPLLITIPEPTAAEAQSEAIGVLMGLERFVDFAEPDYLVFPCVVPGDPAFSSRRMWGLENAGLEAGSKVDADIDAPEAWNVRHDAPSVVVAVTDTGIKYDHEDLQSNMWTDGAGHHGFDAYDNDEDPMDPSGHGTHCAGTIGARGDNGLGLSGVAWQVRLMALRFLGPGGGTTSDAIRVINFARENGSDVISASWGGGGFSQSLYNAIEACHAAGIPFVAAAGNSATNNDATPHYPSGYSLPNVVSVAATTRLDLRSYFSCYGRYSVDLGAPGSDIWSCYTGSTASYRYLDGTSMATPHVAGALALARAHFPGDDGQDLINRLYSSVDRIAGLEGLVATGGRLNLNRLLADSTPSLPWDNLATALRFEGSHGHWNGSNRNAGREVDEDEFSIPGSGIRSLWFAWTAPYEGLVEFVVRASDAPLRLVAFKGTGRDNLILATDGGSNPESEHKTLRFYSTAGQEYRLLVDSFHPEGQDLQVSLGVKPVNDSFAGALNLGAEAFSTTGDSRQATAESFEIKHPHAGLGVGRSLWWKWTPEASGAFVITTRHSEFDTVLAVYTGTPADGLVEVAANDDRDGLDWTSQVEFEAVAGTTYHIAVDGYRNDAAGMISLNGFSADALVITRQPRGLVAPLGGSATFDVVALAGGIVEYQWFIDGEPIPGAESGTLIVDPVGATDFGDYEVELRNQAGSVRSAVAMLDELRTRPSVLSSSGNQAVVAGDPLRLSVVTRGSGPIGYAWTKNGVPIEGADQPGISIPAITPADAGLYVLTASNDLGSVEARMTVTVVNSPFNGWEWRRQAVRNDAITDIRVIDGRLYAVSGEKILVSDDGDDWHPWVLPVGFHGVTLAKLGTSWFCSGTVGGVGKMAVSSDGSTWQAPAGVTGVRRIYTGDAPPMRQMEVFGGKLYAWAKDETSDSGGNGALGYVVVSSDGLNWSEIQLPGSPVLRARSRLVVGPDRLMVPMGKEMFVLDASGWRVVTVTSSADIRSAAFVDGAYHAATDYGIYRSSNGISWERLEPIAEFAEQWIPDTIAVDVGEEVAVVRLDTEHFGWGGAVGEVAWQALLPTGGHSFTAATAFDGDLIYGTSNGVLQRITRPVEFRLPTSDTRPIKSLTFLHGEFIASGTSNIYSSWRDTGLPVLVSGDGLHWREGRSAGTTAYAPTAHLGGRYFAVGRLTNDPPLSGWSPFHFSDTGPGSSFPGRVRSSARDGDTTLVVSSGTSTSASLHVVDEAAWTWSQIAAAEIPLRVTFDSQVYRLAGQWFLTGDDVNWSRKALCRSTDGMTWTLVPNVAARFVVEKSGTLFAFGSDLIAHSSADGVTWSPLAIQVPGGLPSSWSVRELKVFEDSLVALIIDYHEKFPTLLFSQNGADWLIARTPGKLVDIEVGLGQLVGLTTNGGVVHTGRQHPGGSAPVVGITYPPDQSIHFSGATVEVRGSAVDPEGKALLIECLVDGQAVNHSGSDEFSFRFPVADTKGHVVVVRATDAEGLVGSSEVKVNSVEPASVDLLSSYRPGKPLPKVAWATFGGAVYAAGDNEVLRSNDGSRWQRVEIPASGNRITSLAANDRAMVIQFQNGQVATSVDGVNWTQFSDASAIYGSVPTPLRVSNGWFVTSVGSQSGNTLMSSDGLSWQVGTLGPDGDLKSLSRTPGGALMGLEASFRRSVDGGNNWFRDTVLEGSLLYTSGLAVGPDRAVFATKDGKVYVSTDQGARWMISATLPPFSDSQVNNARPLLLSYQAERFFIGADGQWLQVSTDGVVWTPLKGTPVQSDRVEVFAGRFIAPGFDGMAWSQDAIHWMPGHGPQRVLARTLAAAGDFALVADPNGGAWRTHNGVTWKQTTEGAPVSNLAQKSTESREIISFQGLLLSGGTEGVPRFSQDGGASWQSASFQGGPFTAGLTYTLFPGPGVALMIETHWNSTTSVYRSTDGMDWELLRQFRNETQLVDLEWVNQDVWGLAKNGSIQTSSDGGLNWTSEATGLTFGKQVLWFDGGPVAIGTTSTNGNGVNLASFRSPDGTWSTPGPIGGIVELLRDIDCLVTGDGLHVAFEDGRVFRMVSRQSSWGLVATVSRSIYQPPFLAYAEGRYWLGARIPTSPPKLAVQFVSGDAVGWASCTGSEPCFPIVKSGNRFVGIAYGSNGILVSDDGISWRFADSFPATPAMGSLRKDGNLLQVVDATTGAQWTSPDGLTWTPRPDAEAVQPAVSLVRTMVRHGNSLVAGGLGGILISPAGGIPIWEQAPFEAARMDADDWVTHLVSDGAQLFAVVDHERYGSAYDFSVWRSPDGLQWQKVEGLAGLRIVDLAAGDGELLAVSSTGSLFRSLDGGQSWTARPGPALVNAWGITRFAGRWIVFGDTASTSNGYVHSSADGENWSSNGVGVGTRGSFNPRNPFYRIAHGRLIIGTEMPTAQATVDGVQWAPLGGTIPQHNTGNRWTEIVEMPDGYLAVFSSSPSRYGMWFLPIGGSTWSAITPIQPAVAEAERVDGRVFFLGTGSIREWSGRDLAIEGEMSGPVEAGVGSEVDVRLRIENRGIQTIAAADFAVAAWLSTDRFFGDRNDYPIGEITISLPEIAPGAEASIPCSFRLPKNIPVGRCRLVVQLDPAGLAAEANRANNVWIGEIPEVSIAGFSLGLDTIGNGEVARDLGARFYPRGSTVSLAANAGKGAVFAGWGGDALGGESQITILMDGDKSVQAYFSPRVNLQVLVRGAGVVGGLADLGGYPLGETASLTAIPSPGWIFSGWNGAATGSDAGLAIVMNQSKAVTATFLLPFANWSALRFDEAELSDPLISGPDADPDGDGVINRHEHLHGSDPKDPNSTGVLGKGLAGGYLHLSYTRLSGLATGQAPVCQGSRDLVGWAAPDLEERVLETTNGVEVVEARLPVGGFATGFLRIHYPDSP